VRYTRGRVAATRTFLGGAVLVAVLSAAVGVYVALGFASQPDGQSGGPTSTSIAATNLSTSTRTILGSPTSTSSTTSASSGASTAQPFKFVFSTSPDVVLLAPGVTQGYVTLSLAPLPSSLTSDSEVVRLNYSAPGGISVRFAVDPVKIGSGSRMSVPLTLAVSQSTAPGDYKIAIQGNSGDLAENFTLGVRVVQYLVYMTDNSYSPRAMTVGAGSTVFWMNLDAPIGAYPVIHSVTFTTGTSAHSPPLQQYDWYSTTFTAAGNYSYHCDFHPQAMNAVVSVSAG